MVQYGQVVVGPPGSGKTTYCMGVANLLKGLGRKVAIINLDPANEFIPYKPTVDVCELVTVEEVMETQSLGPNGALIYCMDTLEANVNWLIDKIKQLKDHYLIFDFPGQAELYTHHTMVKDLLTALNSANLGLCAVYLLDAHYASDAGKYISAVMLALNSMLQMGLPTVNVLSKVDSAESFGNLQMGLDFYTDVMDLDYLLEVLDDDPLTRRYRKLNKAMADVVTDYSLVSFIPMAADNKSTLMQVMKAVDKANGYVYGANEERNIQRLLSCAVGAEWEHDRIGKARDDYNEDRQEEEEEEAEEQLLEMIARQNEDR